MGYRWYDRRKILSLARKGMGFGILDSSMDITISSVSNNESVNKSINIDISFDSTCGDNYTLIYYWTQMNGKIKPFKPGDPNTL